MRSTVLLRKASHLVEVRGGGRTVGPTLLMSHSLRGSQVHCSSFSEQKRFVVLESSKEISDTFSRGAKHFEDREFGEAAKCWSSVVESIEAKPRVETQFLLLNALNNLACAMGEMGSLPEKILLLRRAMDEIVKHYGESHPQNVIALYNYAAAQAEVGDFKAMKKALLDCVELTEKIWNPGHAKVARSLLMLADAHEALGEYKDQLRVMQRAVPIVERHCGQEHTQTTLAKISLAKALRNNGELQQSLQMTQFCFNNQEAKLGPMHPQLALTLTELARCHEKLGEFLEMKDKAEKAIECQRRSFGQKDRNLVDSYLLLADAEGHLKNQDGQVAAAEEAIRSANANFAGGHQKIGLVNGKAALVLEGFDDVKAVKCARLARSILSGDHELTPNLVRILQAKESK